MAISMASPSNTRNSEEREAARKIVDAANADARANFHRPEFRAAFAQAVTEEIYWGFQHENLLSYIAEVETVPWEGPSPTVTETRGLRAFWLARGGYIESSSIHTEVLDVPRDMVAFSVFEFLDKFRMNFSVSQQELITLGTQRMDAEVNSAALRLMQAAVGISSPSYVATNGLSLSALDNAITAVQDASRQSQVTIVGRASMINQIPNILTGTNGSYPAFLPNTNEEILRTGLLGTYKGANLVRLVNWKDDTDTAFFPGNELYVVAPDASKFAFWGTLESSEWIEPDVGYWHYQAKREFGGIVHRPERIRRIVDAQTSPV